MMSEPEVTRGLPADLVSVLRDQSVLVRQDAAVFELIAAWTKAPSPTASAHIVVSPAVLGPIQLEAHPASTTTPAGCGYY